MRGNLLHAHFTLASSVTFAHRRICCTTRLHSLRVCGPPLPSRSPRWLGHPAAAGCSGPTRSFHTAGTCRRDGYRHKTRINCDKSGHEEHVSPRLGPHHRSSSPRPRHLPSTNLSASGERHYSTTCRTFIAPTAALHLRLREITQIIPLTPETYAAVKETGRPVL